MENGADTIRPPVRSVHFADNQDVLYMPAADPIPDPAPIAGEPVVFGRYPRYSHECFLRFVTVDRRVWAKNMIVKWYRHWVVVRPYRKAFVEQRRREAHRLKAIRELLESECTYLDSLMVLVGAIMGPIEGDIKGAQSLDMSESESDRIFGHVRTVFAVSLDFHDELTNLVNSYTRDSLLGSQIVRVIPKLKAYEDYYRDFDGAARLLQSLRERSTVLDRHLRGSSDHMDVTSYLIMPIQRIPRYSLLLKDIIKHTTESHPDYENLKRAYAMISDLTDRFNEAIREAEMLQEVLELQHQLLNAPEHLTELGLRITQRGVVETHDKDRVHLILMRNVLLVTTNAKKRPQCLHSIPLEQTKLSFLPPQLMKDGIQLTWPDGELMFSPGSDWWVLLQAGIDESSMTVVAKLQDAVDARGGISDHLIPDAVGLLRSGCSHNVLLPTLRFLSVVSESCAFGYRRLLESNVIPALLPLLKDPDLVELVTGVLADNVEALYGSDDPFIDSIHEMGGIPLLVATAATKNQVAQANALRVLADLTEKSASSAAAILNDTPFMSSVTEHIHSKAMPHAAVVTLNVIRHALETSENTEVLRKSRVMLMLSHWLDMEAATITRPVLGAISLLTEHGRMMQAHVCSANIISRLIRFLDAPEEVLRDHALSILANLSTMESARVEIASDEENIRRLIKIFRFSMPDMSNYAIHILKTTAMQSQHISTFISAQVPESLFGFLQIGTVNDRTPGALELLTILSKGTSSMVEFFCSGSGAVTLVKLLGSPKTAIALRSMQLLCCLCEQSVDLVGRFIRHGCALPLFQLLRHECEDVQFELLKTLVVMERGVKMSDLLIEYESVDTLIALMKSPSGRVAEESAKLAQEYSSDHRFVLHFSAADGFKVISRLLVRPDFGVSIQSAMALGKAGAVSSSIRESLGDLVLIGPLISLLQSPSESQREAAAFCVANLAQCSKFSKNLRKEKAGINVLLGLLCDSSDAVIFQAARAVRTIAQYDKCRVKMGEQGITLLAGLLPCGIEKTQLEAIQALRCFADDSKHRRFIERDTTVPGDLVMLMSTTEDVQIQEEAAMTIREFLSADKREKSCRSEGITNCIVALLGVDRDSMISRSALRTLATNAANGRCLSMDEMEHAIPLLVPFLNADKNLCMSALVILSAMWPSKKICDILKDLGLPTIKELIKQFLHGGVARFAAIVMHRYEIVQSGSHDEDAISDRVQYARVLCQRHNDPETMSPLQLQMELDALENELSAFSGGKMPQTADDFAPVSTTIRRRDEVRRLLVLCGGPPRESSLAAATRMARPKLAMPQMAPTTRLSSVGSRHDAESLRRRGRAKKRAMSTPDLRRTMIIPPK